MEVKQSDKTRWSHFCHNKANDGRICMLYSDHYGKHKGQHLSSEWGDDGE